MTRQAGLTLVEVMIALFILAVGVLAAFGLQANSLRGTRTAVVGQDLANIAESELQLQREFERHVTTVVIGETCRSASYDDGFSCQVDVFPCSLSAGSIRCVNGSVSTAVARQITVRVTGPGNTQYRASTVVY